MKQFVIPTLCLCSAALVAGNPRNLPEYRQTLEVTFTSESDAKDAALKPAELPDGKKYAVSTRWDDTNERHAKMAETLKDNDWKGTFYFCQFDRMKPDVAGKILGSGCSIGAHTLHHPALAHMAPNSIFFEIMQIRPMIEAAFDTCVSGFVLPYCIYTTGFKNDETPALIGKCALSAGFLGGPEFWDDVAERYGLTPDIWFGSSLYSANDGNPDEALFEKEFNTRIKNLEEKKYKSGPHFTFGLHTWQTDGGLAVLGRIYKKYAKNPDLWYCNENEYLAYRYQFFHTRAAVKKVKDKTVTFEITRIAAPELGSNIPVTLVSEKQIVSAKLDGKELALSTDHALVLEHPEAFRIPQTIDFVETERNSFASAKKLTGLSVKFHPDFKKRALLFTLKNDSGETLDNLSLIFRLPPQWSLDPIRKTAEKLENGKSLEFKIDFGKQDPRPEFRDGNRAFYAQVDFLQKNTPKRLHAASIQAARAIATSAIRDTAIVLGPVAESAVASDYFQNLSKPDAPLTDVDSSICGKWRSALSSPSASRIVVNLYSTDAAWRPAAEAALKENPALCAVAADFKLERSGKYRLFIQKGDLVAAYCNGQKIENQGNVSLFEVSSGMNRIVYVFRLKKGASLPGSRYFTVAHADDPNDPVDFQTIKRP